MNNNSKLSRYKNPKKQMQNIFEYNKNNYIQYTLRLHKEKDKDIISFLSKSSSLRAGIRELFNKSIKKQEQ